MFISFQIDSTAKIEHPECIKHDLELVYGKNVFSVCCNLLKTVHNVHFISNIYSTANIGHPECIKHDLELVYGKKFFCISMLQHAENCPQCSFHLKYIQHSKYWTSRVHQT
jgi:hypothetical protein